MVRAGRVVAGGFGRPWADEQRTGVAQAGDGRFERLDIDRQVLGRVGVDEVDGGVERRREDDPAVVAQGGGEDVPAGGAARAGRATAVSTASAKAASVVTRMAGESGPCSAWVMRSAATRRGSAGGAARTIPSDGPAGRSMPTSPQTSILAAVTQALPGPTIRSTGARPASGRPNASAPIAWAPPATTKASTSSSPAAPSRTGSVRPSRSAGDATTTRPTPATCAGTTVMTSDDGYGAEPPGT